MGYVSFLLLYATLKELGASNIQLAALLLAILVLVTVTNYTQYLSALDLTHCLRISLHTS